MRSLLNRVHLVPLFAPKAAVTDDTAQVSAIIDTREYDSALIALITGTNADADATFAVTVEHGDAANLSDAAAVAATDLDGTLASAGFTFADDGECRKLAYGGLKRYIRVTVTPTGNTGNLFLAGIAVLGHANREATPTL